MNSELEQKIIEETKSLGEFLSGLTNLEQDTPESTRIETFSLSLTKIVLEHYFPDEITDGVLTFLTTDDDSMENQDATFALIDKFRELDGVSYENSRYNLAVNMVLGFIERYPMAALFNQSAQILKAVSEQLIEISEMTHEDIDNLHD